MSSKIKKLSDSLISVYKKLLREKHCAVITLSPDRRRERSVAIQNIGQPVKFLICNQILALLSWITTHANGMLVTTIRGYFFLLIAKLEQNRFSYKNIGRLFLGFFFYTSLLCTSTPKISIITSVYKGDEFIKGFMEDIIAQTIFDQCELIMIDANSPGNERAVIKEYMERYPNIIYLRLDQDPGLYAVWNMAIAMARGDYITNANLDDRLKYDCYEKHAQMLDAHPEIDLVYSDFYVTYYPNETFARNRHRRVRTMAEFSAANMKEPLPNNHPMWRKSLHDRCGYFDTTYRYVADYEFWLRTVELSAVFMKVPGIYGLYYFNPHGVSTNSSNDRAIKAEEARIYARYCYLFNE